VPALRELQLRFAHALTQPRAPADPRIAIYRHNIEANLRNALAATYRVTRRVLGEAAFDAAADGFARASPPHCADLNVYGGEFAAFLEARPSGHAWLPDLARLEWALDEATRAADAPFDPASMLGALARAAEDAPRACLALHPSCRFLESSHAVMHLWQAGGDASIEAIPELLLVRREGQRPCVERLGAGEHAWLCTLARDATLDEATARALDVDAAFDLAAALRQRIVDGTIVAVR
jgi:hypothetical protein